MKLRGIDSEAFLDCSLSVVTSAALVAAMNNDQEAIAFFSEVLRMRRAASSTANADDTKQDEAS